MLKIKFIVVDRTRSGFLAEGETLYLDRLRRYAHTEWIEIRPSRINKNRPAQSILAEEGISIAKRILPADYVIVLDRSGKVYDSEGLAVWMDHLSTSHNRVTFIIGGPLGLSKEILDRTHETLSLSRLTFTHELSRLVLLEQIYRAFTIIKNEKYHK